MWTKAPTSRAPEPARARRRIGAALAIFGLALAGSAAAQQQWQRGDRPPSKQSLPVHLQALAALPDGSVTALRRIDAKHAGDWVLALPDGARLPVSASHRVVHPNGDISYRGVIAGEGAAHAVLVTEGREAAFGQWNTPRGRYRFESWGDRAWLVDLDHPSLREPASDHDALLPARGTARSDPAASRHAVAAAAAARDGKAVAATQIDVLFAYTAGFAARYPGSASETRVRHLVALANQIFANSGNDLALRVVGIDAVDYTETDSNATALDALRISLGTQLPARPGLQELRRRRSETGADLVTLIRPHDLEVRESCGIAYLFGQSAEYGVNVVSDGFSSWSICADETYAHEVGHNLGAEHQAGASSASAGYGQAFVRPGRFHTVMGSFGTGDPNRGLRLQRFSNPRQRCGGVACGIDGRADNARRVDANRNAVAAYQPTRSALSPEQVPVAIDPDEDGDGVPESADAFPHDARYVRDRDDDGVADEVDAFPDDPAESRDTDGDGIGDNADADRDGDGVLNAADALPLDASESNDADGDGVGDNADRFDDDRREWSDLDADGIGDNADPDTDGDGTPDFDATAQDLLVASVGNDRVLRLDGDSGRLVAVELAETHRPFALGPRSALAWNAYRRRIEALIAGEVRRYDPATRRRETVVLRAFRSDGVPGLPSGLSAGMAVAPDGSLFVGDGARLLRRFDAVTAAEQRIGLFSDLAPLPQPLRALQAGSDENLWVIDRYGNLVEIDTYWGSVLRQRDAPFAPRPGDPQAIALRIDGSVLVADAAAHRVLRLDPAGTTLQDFIAPGSGGLQAPAGLAFDAGGRLYVASAGNDRVLRYDGGSGAFIDVFSQLPQQALREPRSLAFAPRVLDRYPRDPQRRFRPRAGAWYDPANSGQGIDLQAYPGGLVLTWYTYEPDGRAVWYAATGPLHGDAWSATLERYTWDGMRAQGVAVGHVALTFTAEDRAEFAWTLATRSGRETLQHFQAGNSIETQFPTALWYPPSSSGWGYSVVRQGDALALIAFVFDRDGSPTWAIGAGSASDEILAMQRLHAPQACPGCLRGVVATARDIGSLQFAPIDDTHASGRIDLADEDLSWHYQGLDLRRLSDTPTRIDGSPHP